MKGHQHVIRIFNIYFMKTSTTCKIHCHDHIMRDTLLHSTALTVNFAAWPSYHDVFWYRGHKMCLPDIIYATSAYLLGPFNHL